MTVPRIVLFGRNSADQIERLRELVPPDLSIVAISEDTSQAQIDHALQGATVMVSRFFDARHRAATGLRLLQTPGAGWEKVDTGLLPKGAFVCNVHGHEVGIAEYVMLALLEWEIGLRRLDESVRSSRWDGGAFGSTGFHGEVHGKTLGIVGYGSIGTEVAARARAFGLTVGAISRTAKHDPNLSWYEPLDHIDQRLPEIDYLLICCALSPETRNLMDRRRLGLMRKDAVLVNVGRAEIVDQDALYEVLSEQTIGGAVLDVWYRYPTPEDPSPLPFDRPFASLPNVILSPHASAWTRPLMARKWRHIAANICNWDAPDRLTNIVWPAKADARRASAD